MPDFDTESDPDDSSLCENGWRHGAEGRPDLTTATHEIPSDGPAGSRWFEPPLEVSATTEGGPPGSCCFFEKEPRGGSLRRAHGSALARQSLVGSRLESGTWDRRCFVSGGVF